jgi:hypothetical protein
MRLLMLQSAQGSPVSLASVAAAAAHLQAMGLCASHVYGPLLTNVPCNTAEELLRELNSTHLWLPEADADFGLDDVAGRRV